VQDFLANLIVEIVTEYDVDGIQLDDHFGWPSNLGYDPYTIKTTLGIFRRDSPQAVKKAFHSLFPAPDSH